MEYKIGKKVIYKLNVSFPFTYKKFDLRVGPIERNKTWQVMGNNKNLQSYATNNTIN